MWKLTLFPFKLSVPKVFTYSLCYALSLYVAMSLIYKWSNISVMCQ